MFVSQALFDHCRISFEEAFVTYHTHCLIKEYIEMSHNDYHPFDVR